MVLVTDFLPSMDPSSSVSSRVSAITKQLRKESRLEVERAWAWAQRPGPKSQACLGRGSGIMVSVLAFYSDDPSSILAAGYRIFCTVFYLDKDKKMIKMPGLARLKKESGLLKIRPRLGRAQAQIFEKLGKPEKLVLTGLKPV